MNVRQALKKSELITGLVHDTKKILTLPSHIRYKGMIKSYLASHEIKKLQLGAGPTSLDGWLSTDISPQSDHVVFLDATKSFPFDNDTFDYVYSEHMIEHMPFSEGVSMLRECYRVLKSGGAIRIATPDLEVLMNLYIHDEDPLNKKYITWITDNFLPQLSVYRASFVINNAFRNWGHQFLYDSNLLELAMFEAGFSNIRRCSPNKSDNANFDGIETHGNNVFGDHDMADFETMVYEATCGA